MASTVSSLTKAHPMSVCRELDGKMQGSGAAAQRHGVLHSKILRDLFLDGVDILADGGHPVRPDGFVHPVLLIAVHGGR